jgi:plasmid stabilization system protein ParE
MKLVITNEARDDLARIADWIARSSPRRAVSFVDEIEAHCQTIASNPLAYPLLLGHEDSGIRRVVHGNYLIFYRAEPGETVVLHVIHGARDYERILFPDD